MIRTLESTSFTLDDFQESVFSFHCGVQRLNSGHQTCTACAFTKSSLSALMSLSLPSCLCLCPSVSVSTLMPLSLLSCLCLYPQVSTLLSLPSYLCLCPHVSVSASCLCLCPHVSSLLTLSLGCWRKGRERRAWKSRAGERMGGWRGG